jgi:hypothetical protein
MRFLRIGQNSLLLRSLGWMNRHATKLSVPPDVVVLSFLLWKGKKREKNSFEKFLSYRPG